MSTRPPTRRDAAARALPMPTHETTGMAKRLGLPLLRLIDGFPTIVRPEDQ